jgi:hypothetical protein
MRGCNVDRPCHRLTIHASRLRFAARPNPAFHFMEILYSGTDKTLFDSLTWMLTESRIDHETSKRLYRVQINDADEVHQVLVHRDDWDRAAQELDMLTRTAQRKNASASAPAGSRRWHAVLIMIAFGIAGGLAATRLFHSDPNPCIFLPQAFAPAR